MKPGNVLIVIIGVVLAGLAFMLADVSSPKPAGSGAQNSQVRSAIASGQPVLLEFYADWCGPCRMLAPAVEELAREVRGKAQVVRINVDEQADLAQEYGVRSIPAFIALKNGKETSRRVGVMEKPAMRGMLGM